MLFSLPLPFCAVYCVHYDITPMSLCEEIFAQHCWDDLTVVFEEGA
jgi:hypothetical protein